MPTPHLILIETDSPSSSQSGSDDGPRSDGDSPPIDPDPPSRCQIDIQNPCRYPDVGARLLRPLVLAMVSELAPGAGSLTLRFTSDREMRRLNARFRDKDRPTDVLTFPGDYATGAEHRWPVASPGVEFPVGFDVEEAAHVGDIAIAIPTARRQATEQGHGVDREIRILVLHGLLHCLGYDHEVDDGEMEELESELRLRFLREASSQ